MDCAKRQVPKFKASYARFKVVVVIRLRRRFSVSGLNTVLESNTFDDFGQLIINKVCRNHINGDDHKYAWCFPVDCRAVVLPPKIGRSHLFSLMSQFLADSKPGFSWGSGAPRSTRTGIADLFAAAAPQQEYPHCARKQRQRGIDEYPHEGDCIPSYCGECGTELVEPVPE